MNEILINTTTKPFQHQPALACVLGENFMVVWRDASDANIKCQLFAADGGRILGEVVVNDPTPTSAKISRHRPAIAPCGGALAVAWIEETFDPPGTRPHVKAQRFDRTGRKIGPAFQVSTTDIDLEHRPALAGLIDGGFVVTWMDARANRRIRAQRFQPDGSTNGPEFGVNVTEGFHEAPVASPMVGGNFVIAWRSDPSLTGGGAIVFRIFQFDGTPVGGEVIPNLSGFRGDGKAMTFLDNGRFVIAHVARSGQSDIGVLKSVVEARVFESDGRVSDIRVFATSDEGEINSSSPALAPLRHGRFILSWAQKKADTLDTNPVVRAKVVSELGASVGTTTQVSAANAGDRLDVCAAGFEEDENAAAFVAWTDNSKTGGSHTADFTVRGRLLGVLPSGGLTIPPPPH